MTNLERASKWRRDNPEIEAYINRVNGIARGVIRCKRRLMYTRTRMADCNRPSLLEKYCNQAERWQKKLDEYYAELNSMILEE